MCPAARDFLVDKRANDSKRKGKKITTLQKKVKIVNIFKVFVEDQIQAQQVT